MNFNHTPRGYWLQRLQWLQHHRNQRPYWAAAVAIDMRATISVATKPATEECGSQCVATTGYADARVNTGVAGMCSQVATVATLSPRETEKCTINT